MSLLFVDCDFDPEWNENRNGKKDFGCFVGGCVVASELLCELLCEFFVELGVNAEANRGRRRVECAGTEGCCVLSL